MDTYEKKYNEAMLRADEAVQKGCLDKDMFDIIFPPEESEDERIRKWLVDYFSSIKETVWIHRDITCGQILSWLEKQKEPKPTWSEKDDEIRKAFAAFLEMNTGHFACNGFTKVDIIRWLKSPRPSFKPSEEQLNALNFAITYFMHETNYKNPTELRDLYEQLKKL